MLVYKSIKYAKVESDSSVGCGNPVKMLYCYTVTLLPSYTVSSLHCHNVTLSHCFLSDLLLLWSILVWKVLLPSACEYTIMRRASTPPLGAKHFCLSVGLIIPLY